MIRIDMWIKYLACVTLEHCQNLFLNLSSYDGNKWNLFLLNSDGNRYFSFYTKLMTTINPHFPCLNEMICNDNYDTD